MTAVGYSPGIEYARALDTEDPLRESRREFLIPRAPDGSECVYLCGNSLGLQTVQTRADVGEVLDSWRDRAVEGHFHGDRPWWTFHDDLSASMARLTGARPSEVTVMNALTVNLHLMMVSFYRPTRTRYRILMDRPAFPSDRYAVLSQLAWHGLDPSTALLEISPHDGRDALDEGEIEALISREGERIALVLLGGVNYYSGQALAMERIVRMARSSGCCVGLDLAHAVGNIPLSLHDWGADFAVWCTYKYLNGGPGAPGGCFIHERHAETFGLPRFAGWWGNDRKTRFAMSPEFQPAPGAQGWQISNLPILQLAALRSALEVFDRIGLAALRTKSKILTGYLEFLLEAVLPDRCAIVTPRDPERRGCQLSIRLPGRGSGVVQELRARGVVCDWREPDVLRVAPVPLYNTYSEVYAFVQQLDTLLRN